MIYRVRYGVHPESLRSGRMVGPGDVLSDEEAAENMQLIDREIVIAEEEPTAITASESAQEIAAANGVDLGQVKGTGPQGLIEDVDVKKAIEAAEAASKQPGKAGKSPQGEKGGAR